MHMALASCNPLAADAVLPAMAYDRQPCNGGSGTSSGYFFGSRPAPPFPSAAFGAAAQLDVFECLSSDEAGVPAAVPGAFAAPFTQAERVVPDAAGYSCHAARSAAAVAAEGPIRTDRIAFRVRTEEEVLDDGYKWRKYGKKSVKNSPNPRNYYRCSTEGCNVKKRVERDKDDPRYVVTMYEGVHNHVCRPSERRCYRAICCVHACSSNSTNTERTSANLPGLSGTLTCDITSAWTGRSF